MNWERFSNPVTPSATRAGNPRYWGRKASGLLFVCLEDRTVLLLRRSADVEQPGTWGVAGGAIGEGHHEATGAERDPPDQVFLASARREATEELGSLPQTRGLLGVTVFTDGSFTYKTFVYDLGLLEKRLWTPRIVLNWENDEAEWFSVDALPRPLHFGLVHTVRELTGRGVVFSAGEPA